MDIKEFLSEALQQIAQGVIDAQESDVGRYVSPEFEGKHTGHLIRGANGPLTRVDFDLAISSEATAEGKAGLKVLGFSAGVEGGGKEGQANRIAFSVPLKLPLSKTGD